MLRRTLISIVCAAFGLVGFGATRTHDGLGYSTTSVKTGVWSSQFSKCKKYAEDHGVPLIVLWVNPGCSHCEALCRDIGASSQFTKWRKSCGHVFVLGIGDQTRSGEKAYYFAKEDEYSTLHNYPFCAVYMNPLGPASPILKKVFSGNGRTADSFRSKVKSILKNYVRIGLTACDKNGKASVKYGKVVRVGWQKIGKRVTLAAKPKRGCRLIGWYDAKGKLVSKKVNYKVTVKKATKYAVRFGKE